MRVQGSLQAPRPQPLKRRPQAPDQPAPAQERAAERLPVVQLAADADYIPGEEALDFDERQLTPQARRALQGYWSVAHQSHLWVEWRRVDVYV